MARIEEFARKKAAEPGGAGAGPPAKPAVKKQRVIRPAEMVKTTYLETQDDVDGFLDALGRELEKALAKNERIQIR